MSTQLNHPHEPICDGLDGIYGLGLHVGAIFVVLVASLVGTCFPLLGKRVPALNFPEYVYVVGKCLGTGVMIAVGFVHLLGDAALNFRVWCVPAGFAKAYDSWAFLLAVVAVVLMHMIDLVIGDIVHGWYAKNDQVDPTSSTTSLSMGSEPLDKVMSGVPGESEPASDSHALEVEPGYESEGSGHVCHNEGAGHAFHHQHGIPEGVMSGTKAKAQLVVAAVCMEFGTTLHSLFVGLDVGVMSDAKIKPILIALVFHQMFEGLAMGARLADADFNMSLEMVMMLMFSFSAPLGAAVGTICVSISATALTGATYVLVSSILDSLCGGILVYLGLTLMLSDFPNDMRRLCAPGTPHCTAKKIGMFAGLWAGAAGMCLIGKWC